METSAIKRRALDYTMAKTYLVAALFIAGNIILPQLCHLLPQGGAVLLPIYLFTLLAAYRYGWRVGLLTAAASPLLNTLLFGMPMAAALPAILFKSVALALIAAYAGTHARRTTPWVLAAVVVGYQAVGTLFEWVWSGSFTAAVQDFRLGIPGMVLQIAGGWAILEFLLNKR